MANFFEQQRKEQQAQRAAASVARETERQAKEDARLEPQSAEQRKADAKREALMNFKTALLHSPRSVVPVFKEDNPDKIQKVLSEAVTRGGPIPSLATKPNVSAPISSNVNHYHYLLNVAREIDGRISNRASTDLLDQPGMKAPGFVPVDARTLHKYSRAFGNLTAAKTSLDAHFDAHITGRHDDALRHLNDATMHLHSAVKNADEAARSTKDTLLSNDSSNASSWEGMSGPSINLSTDKDGLSFKDRLGAVVDSYKAHLSKVAPENPAVKMMIRQTKFNPNEIPDKAPAPMAPSNKPSKPRRSGPKPESEIADAPKLKQAYLMHLKALREGKIQPQLYKGETGIGAEARYIKATESAKETGKTINQRLLFSRPEMAPLKLEGVKGNAYDDFLPAKKKGPGKADLAAVEEEVPTMSEQKDMSVPAENSGPVMRATPAEKAKETESKAAASRLGLGVSEPKKKSRFDEFEDAHGGARD